MMDDIAYSIHIRNSWKYEAGVICKDRRYSYDKDEGAQYCREQLHLEDAALYEGEDDVANVNGHVYCIRLKRRHK